MPLRKKKNLKNIRERLHDLLAHKMNGHSENRKD